jgi:hypothetical protein
MVFGETTISGGFVVKAAEIRLPYYAPGSDLGFRLREYRNTGRALEAQAMAMDEAAKTLRSLKEMVQGENVALIPLGDVIRVLGPDVVVNKLIAVGLAYVPENLDFGDEEEDEFDVDVDDEDADFDDDDENFDDDDEDEEVECRCNEWRAQCHYLKWQLITAQQASRGVLGASDQRNGQLGASA